MAAAAWGTALAFDPGFTSFIIVGLVGGVAVVLSVAPSWEASHDLARATDHWTLPVVTRTYEADASGRQQRSREGTILEAHGYVVVLQREAAPTATRGVRRVDAEADRDGGRPAGAIVITYQLG